MQTIQDLERENWGDPGEGESYLANAYLQLRRKPIGEFTIEDLRVMIGRDIGTKYLMPYVLDVLESEPLAEGGFYPGDLLLNVLRLSESYWRERTDQLDRTIGIAHRAIEIISTGDRSFLDRKLKGELQSFIWQNERLKTTITTES